MKPSADHNDRLEQLVDRALRAQPLLRAPRSLERRVLAEIERRAALPWWRKNFSNWPIAARLAFLAASLGFVKIGLQAAVWLTAPFDSSALPLGLPQQMSWIQTVVAAFVTVFRSMPPSWIYGGGAVVALMYAALFGIGATAYRTIHAR